MAIRKRLSSQGTFENKALRFALRAGAAEVRRYCADYGPSMGDTERMEQDKLLAWYERKLKEEGDYRLAKG